MKHWMIVALAAMSIPAHADAGTVTTINFTGSEGGYTSTVIDGYRFGLPGEGYRAFGIGDAAIVNLMDNGTSALYTITSGPLFIDREDGADFYLRSFTLTLGRLRNHMKLTLLNDDEPVLSYDSISAQTAQPISFLNDLLIDRVELYAYNANTNEAAVFTIDDVVLELAPVPPVPEASTWAMILMGFGAIGSALRRRNRPPTFVKA